ncbi:hypothetical protein C8R44DRAFT_740823 [Mycena epipterygia]|nr:hypothetical protein C8R44DRAFT_740823 [Mycena epipterygia]
MERCAALTVLLAVARCLWQSAPDSRDIERPGALKVKLEPEEGFLLEFVLTGGIYPFPFASPSRLVQVAVHNVDVQKKRQRQVYAEVLSSAHNDLTLRLSAPAPARSPGRSTQIIDKNHRTSEKSPAASMSGDPAADNDEVEELIDEALNQLLTSLNIDSRNITRAIL